MYLMYLEIKLTRCWEIDSIFIDTMQWAKIPFFMVISNSVSTRISKLTQLFKTLDFLNILLIGVQSQIMT